MKIRKPKNWWKSSHEKDFYSRVTKQSEKNSGSFSDLIGRARERIIEAALWYLTQTDASIIFYSMTSHFTRPDTNGIDAFVVCLPRGASKRIVVPISVTGFMYVQKHLDKHPKIPVISISMNSHRPEYLRKIMKEKNPAIVASLVGRKFLKRVTEAIRESIAIYLEKNT